MQRNKSSTLVQSLPSSTRVLGRSAGGARAAIGKGPFSKPPRQSGAATLGRGGGVLVPVASVLLTFLVGLNIPLYSIVGVALLFAVNLPGAVRHMRPSVGDMRSFLVLAAFVAVYFYLAAYWTFLPDDKAIGFSLIILAGYASGLMLGNHYRRRQFRGVTTPLLGLAAGFVSFAFLCVRDGVSESPTFLISGRMAGNFWLRTEMVIGTDLGMFASLGMCMLPVAILGSDDARRRRVPLRVVLAAMALLGLYANVALQNRSPDIALLVSLFVCSAFYYFRSRERRDFRTGKLALRLVPMGMLAVVVVALFPQFVTNLLLVRFGEQGLETERSDVWFITLTNVLDYPLGGRQLDIGTAKYAHNLWLDVSYTAGIFPLLLLVLFHASHVPSIRRFFRNPPDMFSGMVFLGMSVSMLVACLVEPALDASLTYFAATCFLLGMVRQVAAVS